ncbi:MAG TPA: osmotically inducible protein OsmC [Cryomorphaceae bacterium]|jgi:putative redox protein|nr:MAG: osmotically inducible protein OsmC [Cryomorphaceae bacterium BACL7 MAG-120910-bin2]KRO68250.1 MAG: osmotically inducible protein OsmC [Cryomorphaceae bacterium BACL7 MAG-120322-bin74]KRO83560.1 MAG: osmotically inducible protein OsmC [Cryomorphaceae bacterium BACL7 MAG-121220-bin83]HAB31562.1 osmotically inducible protein OsmC [Cryomorphaceae bacterium]HAG49054.1 osmotically inducible protein OsmC [Cryomorphaceae bacterium]
MATAKTTYLGTLRCTNVHIQSGTNIFTDAPTDNQGKGAAFSPTDLCALSLTTCIITTMGIFAQNHGIEILSATGDTTKHMAADPRRIARIEVSIELQLGEGQKENTQEVLERVAHTCPVARSLHPDIAQRVDITFLP